MARTKTTKYSYTAVALDGSTVTGVEEAVSPSYLRTALLDRDLQPVRLEEKQSIWKLELTKRKVKQKDLMHFSRQLAVFARAGVPILDGLQTIAEEASDKLLQKGLYDMVELLRGGQTLSAAAAAHPEIFPPFYTGMLGAAELTGALDDVLDQVAEYIERDVDARQKITSALVYPAIIAVMSVVVVVVLAVFVIPRFRTFFNEFHAQLPLATRILVSITDFLTGWWPVIVGVIVLLVASVVLAPSTRWGKEKRDWLMLKAPFIGDVTEGVLLERFCRVLSSMIRAGVPLPDAMRVTRESTNNAVYQRGLDEAREAMLRGEGLAGPLTATGLFPASARQMFRVGEDTGTLDDQLDTAAKYFDRELEYRLKRFTALFEPAVIIFMGVVVGFVAIALVSAMYGIFRQVKV
jgi:type IV pilus assembly protein PilC